MESLSEAGPQLKTVQAVICGGSSRSYAQEVPIYVA